MNGTLELWKSWQSQKSSQWVLDSGGFLAPGEEFLVLERQKCFSAFRRFEETSVQTRNSLKESHFVRQTRWEDGEQETGKVGEHSKTPVWNIPQVNRFIGNR